MQSNLFFCFCICGMKGMNHWRSFFSWFLMLPYHSSWIESDNENKKRNKIWVRLILSLLYVFCIQFQFVSVFWHPIYVLYGFFWRVCFVVFLIQARGQFSHFSYLVDIGRCGGFCFCSQHIFLHFLLDRILFLHLFCFSSVSQRYIPNSFCSWCSLNLIWNLGLDSKAWGRRVQGRKERLFRAHRRNQR